MSKPTRILVKLRPGVALAAVEPKANLRPLYPSPAVGGLGVTAAPTWYLADVADGAATAWDTSHSRVADQLNLDESAVVFAEPDLAHTIYPEPVGRSGRAALAIGATCEATPQDGSGGKATGPAGPWHVSDDYSQLGAARDRVKFSDPRTRIAHIDTGYDRKHAARPERILEQLEKNFVDGDDDPNSSQDPGRNAVLDNSGHGTGTIGILAGRKVSGFANQYLGGAPEADILPLRIANRVVLFHTSAFAQALQYAVSQRCDVVTLSMGGLPSRTWSEAVNDAYDAGVCIVAAAGNNYDHLPTRHVVYPARYHRTIAACGVMANGKAYDDLGIKTMEGNFGPESCMTAAVAAYTPNIPWPVFGCETTIRLNGEGTSSATPQIAAAAALWYEKNKSVLPRDWRRVEAVRNALFRSARKGDAERLGNGTLRARAALGVAPALNLAKTAPDSDSFAFLRVLTGLGLKVADVPAREAMFNLELTQLWLVNPALQSIVPDPDRRGQLSARDMRRFIDAVIGDETASVTLRKHLAARYPLITGKEVRSAPKEVVPRVRAACNPNVAIAPPTVRRLRAYAVDPSFSTRLDTAFLNEVTLKIPWEPLDPGPSGEYLKVVDEDAAKTKYPTVDLDDPKLLAQDGCAPAEGNAAFHQQMVYAVAMNTIEHFELALGRPVLWRPRPNPKNRNDDSGFVRQLQIRPHALRNANAYYSPEDVALLFGYFDASADDPGDHAPGSLVYGCLSHDIVAHETTHAILDGMHRSFIEPSNPDVLAMHEGFADIVALMQHFTIPEILENEIGRTRGNIEAESILGSLAIQFGRAMGSRGALRNAIGTMKDGTWTRLAPNPTDYERTLTPHARGAILVAAVFDAFIAIYKRRTADLLRIYTGGTGVLPDGAIHPDLVRRLANEATKSAGHVLNMCIRALDYVPPVDITFGEYLRGIITADFDLVGDDTYGYRIAFVEAFRRRGIYPRDLPTLSVDTLRWDGLALSRYQIYATILDILKRYAEACFYLRSREDLFRETRNYRRELHGMVKKAFRGDIRLARDLGLDPHTGFEVHTLRRSIRLSPDGRYVPQIIAALTQSTRLKMPGLSEPHVFRGGSTLVVDLEQEKISYRIVKNIRSRNRRQRTEDFLAKSVADPLHALLFAPNRAQPFAALHSLLEIDGG